MTELRFYRRGLRYTLEARGHAGAEKGEPLDGTRVCAAVSMAMAVLRVGICLLADRGRAWGVELEEGDGRSYVSAVGGSAVRGAFEGVWYTLELLERQYPERVSVREGRNGN